MKDKNQMNEGKFSSSSLDQKQVQAYEQFYKVLDSLINPFLILDQAGDNTGNTADFTVEFANKAAAGWINLPGKEASGLPLSEIFPKDDNEKLFKMLARAAGDGKPYRSKVPVLKKNRGNSKLSKLIDLSLSNMNGSLCLNWKEMPSETNTRRSKRTNEKSLPQRIAEPAEDNLRNRQIGLTLERTHKMLESTMDNFPTVIAFKDKEGRFMNVNHALEKALKMKREDIIGLRDHDLFPKEMADKFRQLDLEVMNSGKPLEREEMTKLHDGNVIYHLDISFPLIDPEGEIYGVGHISHEITEFKKVEEALRQSEERFFKAFINSPYAMTITKLPKGVWTDVNESFIRLTGYSREELLGHTSADFNMVIEKNPQERARIIKSIAETGSVSDAEVSIKTKTGELRQVVLSAVMTKLNNEDYVITQHVDITERKRAEEALKESRERLLDAQELAHIGSFTFDTETKTYEWTDELFHIYGLDPGKGNPTYEEITSLIHPDDREYIMSALKNAAEGKEDKIEMEYRVVRPDGQLKYIKYAGRPSFDKNAKLTKRFGAVLDITEMKKTQLQLERTIAELERSNRDLERFAYAASHDLQEPIRMMGSYAHLLMKRYKGSLSPKADRYLTFMFEGALRLQLLIRDLLNYARLRADIMSFSRVNLNTVLTAVLDDLKKSVSETGAVVEYGELPEIAADRSQIKQLFANLLSNAINFRKKDTVPEIKISAEDRGTEWLFSVEDNGIGIEPEFAKLIFNVFQRANDREEYPGVGIGLAICKRIVERHEGSIWVESEAGKGSRFHFTIPKKVSTVLK
ncbi:MAG TPA: PAS domain S-box protein [Ignavibacteriales bacterium]|nr:PAS domain S-box protein [Ignavibacteriales bacterium]